MRAEFEDDERLRFMIGDIRDLERLRLAFRGVDIVIHAAAMKQVPACEYNPFEAVQTNILGAESILRAAIDLEVPQVLALSTDKAVSPVNLYGATKLCAEKVFVSAQAYAADSSSAFACVRYGNVVGSRGSVVPLFAKQARTGVITVTDERMTRFWITLDQAVRFVASRLAIMSGGEVYIPKIPSMRVTDVADVLAPEAERKIIGIRPGEKLHEALLTTQESWNTVEASDAYVICSQYVNPLEKGDPLPEGFAYTSDRNSEWLTKDDFVALLKPYRRGEDLVF
jgi:UDP-N-acetylglucosamine 4,6-dehydratase